MSESELVRIERRLIALTEVFEDLVRVQRQIVRLLEPPTTFPKSSGGTITVK